MVKGLYRETQVSVEADFYLSLLEGKHKDTCQYTKTYSGVSVKGDVFTCGFHSHS